MAQSGPVTWAGAEESADEAGDEEEVAGEDSGVACDEVDVDGVDVECDEVEGDVVDEFDGADDIEDVAGKGVMNRQVVHSLSVYGP